jgi:phospholipase C
MPENIRTPSLMLALLLAGLVALQTHRVAAAGIENIEVVVVIYAENRSFDHLYSLFPGANGLQHLKPAEYAQTDRDGSVLPELPPIWGGLTPEGITPRVTQAQTAHLPNKPFAIDNPNGFNVPPSVITNDPLHRFYENQMQINGGKNDRFVAYTDAGALVMGYYDGSKLPLWNIAKRYTLADNFFQGAFGGSFLNHFWLVCACTPVYPNADQGPARDRISAVEADGITLKFAPNSPKSALDGPAIFVKESSLTPDFYTVNTMQPPYQPSANAPAAGGDPAYADLKAASTLPPQMQQTIGDLLTAKGISWAWYAGAWQAALEGRDVRPATHFQPHHQPFNYFATMAPGTAARAQHLRDGGLDGSKFIEAIDSGTLPQVAFYKPQGSLNKHAGYADMQTGDRHIADIIAHLERSPQWSRMLVVITHDENGGFWDHVAPPKGDRWGPGTRVPAIIVSPFAKKGYVDHAQYDTTSILRFIARRFALPILPGLRARDEALAANGSQPLGDLTNAIEFTSE